MDSMKRSGVLWWAVLVLLNCLRVIPVAESLPNCSYPALYTFGDSLSDVGNSIAAFPNQFAHAELHPNGYIFPGHSADRICDGKLLTDFMAFGIHRRPHYAYLRSIAGDYRFGMNFAAIGGSARNSTKWTADKPVFSSPFSLNVQVEWFKRYVVRLGYYYFQTVVTQAVPAATSLNTSMYMVYSGYQDYFFGLLYKDLTPKTALDIVVPVVSAISDALTSLLGSGYAKDILVVNLPPLGCIPAMLTMFPGTPDKYDGYGCLKSLNKITAQHNKLLGESIASMRPKYTDAKLYYGDLHGVYTDILKHPAKYNVTEPLKAACGYGGKYNFNLDVTCGYTGTVGNTFVNLTTWPLDLSYSAGFLSWDGIHTSNTFNKAVATAFLTAKYITPTGGFQCAPDFDNWDVRI